MFILHVIPFQRSTHQEELSYFSINEVSLGTCVEVPYGTRILLGAVTSCVPLSDMRSQIKNMSFQLKNIHRVIQKSPLSPAVLLSIQSYHELTLVPRNLLLDRILPIHFLTTIREYVAREDGDGEFGTEYIFSEHHITLLQQSEIDRMHVYITRAREVLSRETSIVIVCPSVSIVKALEKEIGKGINAHTVSLHGHLTKKKQDEVYKKLLDTQRGLVCIMTPYFLGCIPTSTSLIIIHNSASSEYQSVMGPYINFVSLIENFARIAGIECMFSDTLLPLTTTARVTNESLVSWYAHASYRSQHNSVFHSLDHTFSKNIIHPDILEATKQKIQEGKNIAFFVPRIGYASLTKCNDCQHVMACTHCDAPLRLHRTITTHYTCSRCSTSIPPIDFCQTCGGSRLALLGISVGKIIEALGEHIDQDSIIPVTAETIHKKKNMVHIDQIMQKNQGACYVGTTALLNLPYQFDTMVIVSAAHLFAHTEYSSYEESLRLGMQLREHTLHDFFIQTPAQYTTLVSTYWHMPIQEQLSYEDALRKEYHLPPYLHKAHIICSPKGAELLKKLISTSVHMLASYKPKIITRMPYHGYRGGLCVEISFAHRSDLKKLIETLQGLKEYVYVLEK